MHLFVQLPTHPHFRPCNLPFTLLLHYSPESPRSEPESRNPIYFPFVHTRILMYQPTLDLFQLPPKSPCLCPCFLYDLSSVDQPDTLFSNRFFCFF